MNGKLTSLKGNICGKYNLCKCSGYPESEINKDQKVIKAYIRQD